MVVCVTLKCDEPEVESVAQGHIIMIHGYVTVYHHNDTRSL